MFAVFDNEKIKTEQIRIQKCMNKYTFSMYKYVKWFVSFLIFLSFGRG